MDVREIMTTPVQTLGIEDSLNAATKMMRDHAVGCLPVVNDSGVLVGILTDRDIALSAYEFGEALWRLRVVDSMHRHVWTCHVDDGIEEAAKIMRAHRVRRLPVLDAAGAVVGLVSLDDLAHASRQPVIDPTPGLTTDEIGDIYNATSGRSKHDPSRRS